jgi:hypothetical protein
VIEFLGILHPAAVIAAAGHFGAVLAQVPGTLCFSDSQIRIGFPHPCFPSLGVVFC